MEFVRVVTGANPWVAGGVSLVAFVYGALMLVCGLRRGQIWTGRIPSRGAVFSRREQPTMFWTTAVMLAVITGLALAVFALVLEARLPELIAARR